MSAHPVSTHAHSEGEYEDLLSLWSDLESALSVLLSRPLLVQDFPGKVRQFDAWLQDLVAHDIDAALYLMFQHASTSTVGYSASHALVCGTLCHIMALELKLPQRERDSLVRAALTMNIGMTALQDELAVQRERPTAEQQEAIKSHPEDSMLLLERLFINDQLWLDVVGQHHASIAERIPLAQQEPIDRLTRVLGTIDRYAAMISPRKSRAGRSATRSGGSSKSNRSTRMACRYAYWMGVTVLRLSAVSSGTCTAGGGGGIFCGLLSAPIDAWTMKVGLAGGSPRSIWSTASMPAITRPKLV